MKYLKEAFTSGETRSCLPIFLGGGLLIIAVLFVVSAISPDLSWLAKTMRLVPWDLLLLAVGVGLVWLVRWLNRRH